MAGAKPEDGAVPAAGPNHHVPDELLLDHASGRVPEAMALLITTHLAFCRACRATVAALESLGGSMLEEAPPVPLDPLVLPSLLSRLDEPLPRTDSSDVPDGTLPRVLLRHFGRPLHELDWRTLLPGVREARLPLPQERGRAGLLLIRPGRSLPRHTHLGSEMTLVLSGGFSDASGEFRRGDVATVDGSVDHHPVAGPEEDCLCLVVTDAPLRLTGPIGRLFNRFISF